MRTAWQHYVGGELDGGRKSHLGGELHTLAELGIAAKLSNEGVKCRKRDALRKKARNI